MKQALELSVASFILNAQNKDQVKVKDEKINLCLTPSGKLY